MSQNETIGSHRILFYDTLQKVFGVQLFSHEHNIPKNVRSSGKFIKISSMKFLVPNNVFTSEDCPLNFAYISLQFTFFCHKKETTVINLIYIKYISLPTNERRHVPPKLMLNFKRLYCVIFQKE
jgi:hypothetical protein